MADDRITGSPLLPMACHCTGCQRRTGSAFALSAAIPSAGFAVTQGEPLISGLHGELRHFFCPHCMSWLFPRVPSMDQFVKMRATMLDDAAWTTPFIETYTSEKLAWAVTPAVHSFARFPDRADYPALTQAYAASAAHPST